MVGVAAPLRGRTFTRELNAKQVLVYVLDVAGSEGRDAMSDLLALKEELDLYLPGALLD